MYIKSSISVLFLFVLLLNACQPQKPEQKYIKFAGKTQGTTYHITCKTSDSVDVVQQIVDSILHAFDMEFSIYNKQSTITKVNNNDSTAVLDSMFIEMINFSRKINQMSAGSFDITVGPLVNAWGFGPDTKKKPSQKTIDSLLVITGMSKIKIEGNKLIKSSPKIRIDVNGIAQGYSVDLVADFFEKSGVENYMVEIGGEVRCKGVNEKGKLWRIGIDKPVENNNGAEHQLQAIVELNNESVSTSGSYRRFYIENGVKYSHTINPFNGYPARNTLLSVTIFDKKCAFADAVATACMVKGLDSSKLFLSENKIKAYMIYSDLEGNLKEYYSKSLDKNVFDIE